MEAEISPSTKDGDLPGERCLVHVENPGGMMAYPCWLPKDHKGPCMATEIPSSIRRREAWEAEQKAATPTRATPRDEADQPLPTPNHHIDVQTLLVRDIEARRDVGIERYGTALQPDNGRDMLQDALDEAIDLGVYVRGEMARRDLRRDEVPERAKILIEAINGKSYSEALEAVERHLLGMLR